MNGGARRDRTADLLRATQALSQLSYSPEVLETLSKLRFRLYIMLASVFNILFGGSMVA